MSVIITCSISEVVVTQLPDRAVLSPTVTEIAEAKNEICIALEPDFGLEMAIAPKPAITTPKTSGKSAVT